MGQRVTIMFGLTYQSLSVVMKLKSNFELPCIDTPVKTTLDLLFCNLIAIIVVIRLNITKLREAIKI